MLPAPAPQPLYVQPRGHVPVRGQRHPTAAGDNTPRAIYVTGGYSPTRRGEQPPRSPRSRAGSNDCEANPPKHGDGSTLPVSASHNSSLTGTSSLQPHAELWEPYDGRLSRTVLREREGEVPSRHSPGLLRPRRQPLRRRIRLLRRRRVHWMSRRGRKPPATPHGRHQGSTTTQRPHRVHPITELDRHL